MKQHKQQIEQTIVEINKRLKDFQRATVDHIDKLYRNTNPIINRVLVADEVGLGKTMIAQGVISRMAKLRMEEGDDLFKVVYVCSNASIARQNIETLDIFNVTPDNVAETRLSMQHLKVLETEKINKKQNKFVQLIPLTPLTSFRINSGAGTMYERALMYVVLTHCNVFGADNKAFEQLMKGDISNKHWEAYKQEYIQRVNDIHKVNSHYPQCVVDEIKEKHSDLYHRLETFESQKRITLIGSLRKAFASVSIKMLNPDLVIMDEFQRFRFLINPEAEDDESLLLAKEFLKNDVQSDNRNRIRVLLLSATPYKLYSTLEEINDANQDEQYHEFLDVIKFLKQNGDDVSHYIDFKANWDRFSSQLRQFKVGDTAVIQLKRQVEDNLYQNMCRTERLSVMQSHNVFKPSTQPVEVTEGDIGAYIDMQRVAKDLGLKSYIPVDYVKSCPFLLSFMQNYQVKEDIRKSCCKNSKGTIEKLRSKWLWINKKSVKKYKPLPACNARLEALKMELFTTHHMEKLMWIPPSMPYYNFGGVYRGQEDASKVLVFSAWEMVPRMIACLVSYESERKTIGKLPKSTSRGYFSLTETSRERYPVSPLRKSSSSSLVLLYPCKTLSTLYDPITCHNLYGSDFKKLEAALTERIKELIAPLKKFENEQLRERSRAWYYMVPFLLDNDMNYFNQWKSCFKDAGEGITNAIDKIERMLDVERPQLGKMPEDLADLLVNMTLGNPATCIDRANQAFDEQSRLKIDEIVQLTRVFYSRFSTPEATAIINLAYSNKGDDESFWRDVLHYCSDGNFQAMIDEYFHMITDGKGFPHDKEGKSHNFFKIIEALQLRSSSYQVDDYKEFASEVASGKNIRQRAMRSHFAMCFAKGKDDDFKGTSRRDIVRNAFNSPMRPFVLASTSIGQEGLDFHYYCRKIMHWNLPSNPIDLEQREGRINRYKCLSVRKSIAEKFKNRQFKHNIWNELFAIANEHKTKGMSDLTPYWYFKTTEHSQLKRIVPMYPFSFDQQRYERIMSILSLYRLTMGQVQQEDLIDYLMQEFQGDTQQLNALFFNLSPIAHLDNRKKKHPRHNKTIMTIRDYRWLTKNRKKLWRKRKGL